MPEIWSLGEVLEFAEHPERRVRCGDKNSPENAPFIKINRLGELLNQFPKEEQDMFLSNFFDTLEQMKENA